MRDRRGVGWDLSGEIAALDAAIDGDRFDSESYPDALSRLWSALAAPHGADILVSATGSAVSSDTDALGLDEDSSVFSPRVDFSWGPADLMLTVYEAEFQGTGTTPSQLDLGGVIIAAGDTVQTDLDVSVANLIATFDLLPTGFVDLGAGFGLRLAEFSGNIRSTNTGLEIGSDETFILPALAAHRPWTWARSRST